MMKKYYSLFFLLALFLSSCDRRPHIATSFLEETVELQNIDVLSSDFDSISIPMHDSIALIQLLEFSQLKEEYETALSDYKQKHFAGLNRVWMKTMTKEQLTTYRKLEEQHGEFPNSLWSIFRNALPNKEKNTSVWLKYKKRGSDSIKYGVFYFNVSGDINNHIIFNEDAYYDIKELVDTYKKLGVAPKYTAPNFDSIGLDIVPVDEDPTKTKEERKAIKEKEYIDKRAKERAEMMKTNPIQRTFYGATLGTNSAMKIVNRLRTRGCKVIEYTPGNYISLIQDHVDVIFWDEIRIISESGKITKIELTQVLDLDLDDYTKEKAFEKFYKNIVNKYMEKYSFWAKYYDGTEYKDEKTTLKIENDDDYRVWATYTLNE